MCESPSVIMVLVDRRGTVNILVPKKLLLQLRPHVNVFYVAAKATFIRLLHGKIGFLGGFFGPKSVKRGRTHIVLG